MEFFIILAVIFVLLLILGVNIQILLALIIWLSIGILMLQGIYYMLNIILWLFGKPCEGNFVRVEEISARNFSVVYQVNNAEYKNYFFMETKGGHIFDNQKIYKLHILKIGKLALAIDKYCILESVTMLTVFSLIISFSITRLIIYTQNIFLSWS
ncbi:MAG: hypothetical protein K2H93_00010 [Oscillospiraceae bacterium]|nr:hypothetical protein [Oscillospiraceae bacterium]